MSHAPNPPDRDPGRRGRATTPTAARRSSDDTTSSETTQVAAEEAARLREEAKDSARAVADEAASHAKGVMDVAVAQVRDRADEQVQRAGGGLRQAGDQLQALAQGNPDEAGPWQGYLESAASAMTDWADRIDRRGLDGLLGDMSDFARRKPGQFLAGAFAAGILAGRVGRNVSASDVELPASPSDDDPAGLLPATTDSAESVGGATGADRGRDDDDGGVGDTASGDVVVVDPAPAPAEPQDRIDVVGDAATVPSTGGHGGRR